MPNFLPSSRISSFLLGASLSVLLSPLLFAQEAWTDFRGPSSQGISTAKDLPLQWSEEENIRWKQELPGQGWSTPVILDGQLWMTAAKEEGRELYALCVDEASGDLIHEILVFQVENPEPINATNSYASPSPVIEPGRVYVYFGTYGVACLDTESAEILWSRQDLKLDHKEGPGSSPVLYEDRLFLTCDGMDVQYLIALDKSNGKTIWKTERTADFTDVLPDRRKAYSTPLVVETDERTLVVSTGANGGYAYDAETGEEIWKVLYDGFSNVSRPVHSGDIVYLNTGYFRPQLLAIRLGGMQEVTESHLVWSVQKSVSIKPSILKVEDLIFMVTDRGGIATCLDANTGEVVWMERLGGNFSSSPIYANGYLYFGDQEGTTSVIRASRDFEVIAENKLDEGLMASPAVSGDSLYLRTPNYLYRIEKIQK
ncbi:Outer membrane biogenesis protein BamB [Planctomycetales bacterium 10988]|nr:Outer membrane biogenesis protein BamB [Planctomycetales bacterium 10988]